MSSKADQIYRYIFRAIRSKRYTGKIPTEAELCKKFNVSRGTVRVAIQQLVERKFLIPRKGSGVFINEEIDFGSDSKLIVTISGDSRNSFYGGGTLLLLSSIMREVFENKDSYLALDEIAGNPEGIHDAVVQVMPDGIIWLVPDLKGMRDLQKLGIPIVSVWGIKENGCEYSNSISDLNGVLIDKFQEAYLYANHCLKKGFEKLLIVSPRNDSKKHCDFFIQGARQALKEHGCDPQKNIILIDSNNINSRDVKKAIRKKHLGIYTVHVSFGFLKKLFDEEGLGDREFCLFAKTKSPATSRLKRGTCELIDFPHEEMGRKAVELLNDLIDSPNSKPKQILFSPQIINT